MKVTDFILFAAFVFIALFFIEKVESCNKKTSLKNEVIKSDTITRYVHDSIWYQMAEKRSPKAADSVFVPLPAIIDTMLILKDYFAKYYYVDTLRDTNLIIVLKDTISRNKIISRAYAYRFLRPQVIQQIVNTTIKEHARSTFYIGVSTSLNKNFLAGLGPELLFTNNKAAYGMGYDLLNKGISIKTLLKIK